MNRLIFPNGGMPFQLDDLDFMQESTKEVIKGLLHEFASQKNGNIILSGCKVSENGSNFDISEGFVMLDYEVLYFSGVTAIAGSQPYFELSITYDPAGNDVFFDNVSRDTYEVRKATYSIAVPSGANVRLLDSNRLTTLMKLSLLQPDVDWGQAYVNTATKTLDLTKDVDGNVFADPQANYSKKYIYVKTTGGQAIEKIFPYPSSGVARSYIIVPAVGSLRFFDVGSSGTFVGDRFSTEFMEIAQNESIEVISINGVYNGGAVPFDYWRIKNGGAATLNKINVFARTQREAKTTATIGGVNTLQLNFEGNTFKVDTSSQRTVSYISSLGVGTKIHLIADSLPFLINHNVSGAPSGYKPIVLPDGQNLDCVSNNATISLVEHDTHWRVQGADKKRAWVTVPYTSLSPVNMTLLASSDVKYVDLGGGLIQVSFSLNGSVGTGNPTILSFTIPNVNVVASTFSSCAISGSNTGRSVGRLFTQLSNEISIQISDVSPFGNNETISLMGQITINANIV